MGEKCKGAWQDAGAGRRPRSVRVRFTRFRRLVHGSPMAGRPNFTNHPRQFTGSGGACWPCGRLPDLCRGPVRGHAAADGYRLGGRLVH